jgi:hypothetical protein
MWVLTRLLRGLIVLALAVDDLLFIPEGDAGGATVISTTPIFFEHSLRLL